MAKYCTGHILKRNLTSRWSQKYLGPSKKEEGVERYPTSLMAIMKREHFFENFKM